MSDNIKWRWRNAAEAQVVIGTTIAHYPSLTVTDIIHEINKEVNKCIKCEDTESNKLFHDMIKLQINYTSHDKFPYTVTPILVPLNTSFSLDELPRIKEVYSYVDLGFTLTHNPHI